jgi:hypothetical protein
VFQLRGTPHGRLRAPRFGGPRRSHGGGGAERAAHLADHVFPVVPIRQWVLTLPHRMRYVLAWDHGLCRAVMRIFMTAVLGSLRRRARRTQGVAGRSGAVVIVQRPADARTEQRNGRYAADAGRGAGPPRAPVDRRQHVVHGVVRRRRRGMKAQRAHPILREHAVEHEGMPRNSGP